MLLPIGQGAEIIEDNNGAGRQSTFNCVQSADLRIDIIHIDVSERNLIRETLFEAGRYRPLDYPHIWERRESLLNLPEQRFTVSGHSIVSHRGIVLKQIIQKNFPSTQINAIEQNS